MTDTATAVTAGAGLDEETRYQAVSSRDARFDGVFFFGVATTGIYCRPSCPAVTPKRRNVTFYPTAAAAQAHGFRACRRCRPDAVPGSAEWNVRADVVGRAMRMIGDGVVDREGVPGLADRLGYSARQVQRQLTAELGAGPVALARAQRAHTARVLLQTTDLPVTEIAFAAGFASVRQFNDTIRAVYARTPTALRAESGTGTAPGGRTGAASGSGRAGAASGSATRSPTGAEAGSRTDSAAAPRIDATAGSRGATAAESGAGSPAGHHPDSAAAPRTATAPGGRAGAASRSRTGSATRSRTGSATPSQPESATPSHPDSAAASRIALAAGVPLRLAHRGPYAAGEVFDLLAAEALPGVEEVVGAPGARTYRRTLRLPYGTGMVSVDERSSGSWLEARIHLTELRDLTTAVQRLRRLLDLDADPYAVAERLGADPDLAAAVAARPGLRSPGTAEPEEFALRTVVGPEEAVRLVERHGTPLETACGTLTHLFPEPAALTGHPVAGPLATALADGTLRLDAGADRDASAAALAAVAGVGAEAVAAIRTRALADPDVPAPGLPDRPEWRPWRSYAARYLAVP
ncbi:AlkA N-terminal domain-containing protein [Streptomyces sp. NPDC004327]|uniref:DNA-3-methyladenine glycosylase 2 family protein n=1 Tax=Streptomyces sp. NPDC004327 TaxID=3364699 RepID=UPI0036BCBFCB